MSERLTSEELDAIRARAEKATAGPWYREYGDVKTVSIRSRKYDEPETIAEMYYDDFDAEFIAHARQDVPNLLAEVERLQTELYYATRHERMGFDVDE